MMRDPEQIVHLTYLHKLNPQQLKNVKVLKTKKMYKYDLSYKQNENGD